MATMGATPTVDTSLGAILEQVAKEKGIDRKILVETIEAAILKAAQSVFGPTRELEARFNEDSGQVDLFQYMTVVEDVAEPEREISLADVEKHKLDATLGEELGFQVFWRPEDAEKARRRALEHPGLSMVDDDPLPNQPIRNNHKGVRQGYNPYESGLLKKEYKKKTDLRELSKWLEMKRRAEGNKSED